MLLLLTSWSLVLKALSVVAVEATWEYSVQVSAQVQSSPPQILLVWPQDSVNQPTSYTVSRKGLADTNWGSAIVLAGTVTNYLDTRVTNGGAYDYQVVKQTAFYTGYGYIYAGINTSLTEARGTVLLVVDNTFAGSLSNQLALLQQDLVGDGWTVQRLDISRNATVQSVKALIVTQYQADPTHVKALFLFGHVPVPYSGDIVPDGHIPDHQGAWPADVYYGDMTGVWTDSQVNDTGASDPRNWNVSGDGKFDQASPGPVKLMIGRVDLANMPGQTNYNSPPTFPGEQQLLANYLSKDHNFRHKLVVLPRRGVVGDYFGVFGGEAFAASAWRNFAPMFGATNIVSLPTQGTWLPTLATNGYEWAYAGGAGSPNGLNGIGNQGQYFTGTTTDIVGADVRVAFTFLFGSWFGDWDATDNLMRSILATPTYGLACAWSGRPHWFCHHMALGESIGYGARLTQNNGPRGLYQNQTNGDAGLVHIALMGDPTLRLHPVSPPSGLLSSPNFNWVSLVWSASPETVLGYYVYRATNAAGPFSRLTGSLLAGTAFTDTNPATGLYTYMVRAVKLEQSASGTYYNASQGIFTTINFTNQALLALKISRTASGPLLFWNSQPDSNYHVLGNGILSQSNWVDLSGSIIATSASASWLDTNANPGGQRFYRLRSP